MLDYLFFLDILINSIALKDYLNWHIQLSLFKFAVLSDGGCELDSVKVFKLYVGSFKFILFIEFSIYSIDGVETRIKVVH